MKTAIAANKVEQSQEHQTEVFGVDVSDSHIFTVLSDNLYRDKHLAVIRELACNGMDSHVAAGRPTKPLTIHLPSPDRPEFVCRDYGTGLTPTQISEVYKNYLKSTKRDTTMQVGQLGVGSKSPFCYSDVWTVTSYVGGKKWVYSCYRNEEYKPAISLLLEEDTNEPDGVEVTVPTNGTDDSLWQTAAWRALSLFDVRPTVENMHFDWDDYPAVVSGKDGSWAVLHKYSSTSTGFRLVGDKFEPTNGHNAITGNSGLNGSRRVQDINFRQGNVIYTATWDDISAWSTQKMKTLQQMLSSSYTTRSGLVICVPIGSLHVAVSRETLSYDSYTKNNVIIELEKIYDEMYDQLEVIDQIAVPFDRYKAISELPDWMQSWGASMFPNAGWANQTLEISNDLLFDNMIIQRMEVNPSTFNHRTLDKVSERRQHHNANHIDFRLGFDRLVDCGCVVFELSGNTFSAKDKNKLRQHVLANSDKFTRNQYIVIGRRADTDESIYAILKDQVKEAFLNCEIIDVASLADAPKGPAREKKERGSVREYTMTSNDWNVWKLEDVDVNAGGYFVVRFRDDIIHSDSKRPISNLSDLARLSKVVTDKKSVRVAAFTPAAAAKLDMTKWKHFPDVILDALESKLTHADAAPAMAMYSQISYEHEPIILGLLMSPTVAGAALADGEMKAFVETIQKVFDVYTKSSVYQQLADDGQSFAELYAAASWLAAALGRTGKIEPVTQQEGEERWKALLKRYPLLDMISMDPASTEDLMAVVEYINMIDNKSSS